MLADESCNRCNRIRTTLIGAEREYNRRRKQLARLVDRSRLAARANAGVKPKHALVACRRRKKQIAQIGAEDVDGRALGSLAQPVKNRARRRPDASGFPR